MENSNVVSLVSDMIAIPSVNPMGQDVRGGVYSEKDLVQYLYQRIKRLNFDIQIIDEDSDHPCIIATYDIGAKETVLLDSHLDTVSHLNMEIDPFDPLQKDGLLYGRGSCDTKASMAVYIAALESLLSQGKKLSKNVILLGCSDEEFSFTGIKKLDLGNLKADYAIVGEPTELNGLNMHKGVLRCYIRAKGEACHSSTPELGRNAIYMAADAVKRLEAYHHSLQATKHPILGSPTLSVGMIAGGTTVNTVPPAAYVEIDRRLVPGEDPEQVYQDIKNCVGDIEFVNVEDPYVISSGFEEKGDSSVCKMMHHHCQHFGKDMELTNAAFATHAPFYKTLGIPTLVFGPGSIRQAHTKNEYVPLDQLEKAYLIIRNLLEN